jgi:hypothetical protein
MRGGARPGSGRPTKADEELVRNQSIGAIVQLYGSVQNGFKTLLESKEASLIKFVWEHAVGKPKEKVEHSGDLDPDSIPVINITVVRNTKKPDNDTSL